MYHLYDSMLTSIPCISPHTYKTYHSVGSIHIYHLACIIHRSIPFNFQYTDSYTIHLVVYRQEHHSVGSIYTDIIAIRLSVYRQVSLWLGCIQTSVIYLAVCGLVYHSVSGIKMSLPYSCCIWTSVLYSCYYREKYTINL